MAEGTHIIVDLTPDNACASTIYEEYGKLFSDWVEKQTPMEVGDACTIRDCLLENGFDWGTDFYMKRLDA